jgi:hypothetical protein
MSGTASSAALQFQNAISLTSTASTITINAQGQITITSSANVVVNKVTIDPNGNVTLPAGATLKADFFAATSQAAPTAEPHMTNSDGLSTNEC